MVAPIAAEKIVYCVSSVQKIIDLNLDFVFTDGHAVNSFSTQYMSVDIHNIDTIVVKKALEAKYWTDENDLDIKRRKEAEFLVLGDIAKEAIHYFLTYNENAKNKIINFGANASNVRVRPEFYF
jgi:ssDNA thymidine ADP-ribosyltransferase, DarT